MQLVHSRTTHILAVENITARQYGARMSSNQVKELAVEMVEEMPFPKDVGLALKSNVAVITTLSAQIELLERRLQLCLLRALRRQRAHQQWQEKRRRKYEER
jgi:hypothetical protein